MILCYFQLSGKEKDLGTIIDSLISSLPIVSSDWNYNSEIINSDVGYIFESKNQEAFNDVIKKYYKIQKNY